MRSYRGLFGDVPRQAQQNVEPSLLYQYLTMSVKDAEYPTAVPLLVAGVVLGSLFCLVKAPGYLLGDDNDAGLRTSRKAYLNMAGH